MPPSTPSFTGRICPPTEPYLVGREKIREFADAIGAADPAHRDPIAAAQLVYPRRDRSAHLPVCLAARPPGAPSTTRRWAWTSRRVVHGDQRFAYTRPVVRRSTGWSACADGRRCHTPGRQRLPDHPHRHRTDGGRAGRAPSGPGSSLRAESGMTELAAARSATPGPQTLPDHPGRPGPLRRRLRRLQPDPLERPVRARGRAARRHRPRHVHHGAGRPGGHRLGGGPARSSSTASASPSRCWSRTTTTAPGRSSGSVRSVAEDRAESTSP